MANRARTTAATFLALMVTMGRAQGGQGVGAPATEGNPPTAASPNDTPRTGDGPAVPFRSITTNTDWIAKLLRDGYERSATFRSLVDILGRSDASILIYPGPCDSGRFRSCVSGVLATSTRRRIDIRLWTRTGHDRLIATIAHELHHAIEIVDDPLARDAKTVLALYRRIGTSSCRASLTDKCETREAQEVEYIVNGELHAAPRGGAATVARR